MNFRVLFRDCLELSAYLLQPGSENVPGISGLYQILKQVLRPPLRKRIFPFSVLHSDRGARSARPDVASLRLVVPAVQMFRCLAGFKLEKRDSIDPLFMNEASLLTGRVRECPVQCPVEAGVNLRRGCNDTFAR